MTNSAQSKIGGMTCSACTKADEKANGKLFNFHILKKERGKYMKKEIILSGMTCGHCVKRVENALLGIDGVHSVVVSLDEKKQQLKPMTKSRINF